MTKKPDGGPAFPNLRVVEGERDGHGDVIDLYTTATGGMSLRDRMAIGCMDLARADYFSNERKPYGEQIKEPILPYATKGAGTMAEIIARRAYEYADAMIAERAKP